MQQLEIVLQSFSNNDFDAITNIFNSCKQNSVTDNPAYTWTFLSETNYFKIIYYKLNRESNLSAYL